VIADTALPADKPPREEVSDSELEVLFQKYPTLRQQLQRIYEITVGPAASSRGTGQAQHRTEGLRGRAPDYRLPGRGHDVERGINTGVNALRAALDESEAGAEGLEAFVGLISKAGEI